MSSNMQLLINKKKNSSYERIYYCKKLYYYRFNIVFNYETTNNINLNRMLIDFNYISKIIIYVEI